MPEVGLNIYHEPYLFGMNLPQRFSPDAAAYNRMEAQFLRAGESERKIEEIEAEKPRIERARERAAFRLEQKARVAKSRWKISPEKARERARSIANAFGRPRPADRKQLFDYENKISAMQRRILDDPDRKWSSEEVEEVFAGKPAEEEKPPVEKAPPKTDYHGGWVSNLFSPVYSLREALGLAQPGSKGERKKSPAQTETGKDSPPETGPKTAPSMVDVAEQKAGKPDTAGAAGMKGPPGGVASPEGLRGIKQRQDVIGRIKMARKIEEQMLASGVKLQDVNPFRSDIREPTETEKKIRERFQDANLGDKTLDEKMDDFEEEVAEELSGADPAEVRYLTNRERSLLLDRWREFQDDFQAQGGMPAVEGLSEKEQKKLDEERQRTIYPSGSMLSYQPTAAKISATASGPTVNPRLVKTRSANVFKGTVEESGKDIRQWSPDAIASTFGAMVDYQMAGGGRPGERVLPQGKQAGTLMQELQGAIKREGMRFPEDGRLLTYLRRLAEIDPARAQEEAMSLRSYHRALQVIIPDERADAIRAGLGSE
jgi:hypothetical protein